MPLNIITFRKKVNNISNYIRKKAGLCFYHVHSVKDKWVQLRCPEFFQGGRKGGRDAESLNRPASTVSAAIRALELMLGCDCFISIPLNRTVHF